MKHFYSIACRFGLIGVLVFGLQVSVFPQTYQLTSVSGTFTPLIEGTNVASTQTDDGISDTIDIGFDFVFYGVSYSQLIACSNGYISFNLSAGSDFNNTISSGDASLRPLIAPFWADLNGDLGTSAYKLEGSAPNRTFTFEWLNFKWDYEATEPGISFQVLLHETTNVIEFIYKQESGGINNGIASIGLSISTVEPSDPIFYSLNDAGTNPSLSSTVATDNISTKPATGQVYRFTQQTLPEPTNHATAFAASTNHTYITLSWTDAAGSQLPDGYLIIASDANNIIDPVDLIDIVPDNDIGDGSAIVKVSQGKQTYSDFSNLQYNATYYFKIYSFTNSGTLIDYKTLPAAPETLLSYTPFPEPTNHVTSFSALRGYSTITLNWTDAIGSQLPNGYLIIVSNADNIVDPIDLTDIVPDSNLNDGIAKVKVNQGIQTYSGFTNLQFNNTYYFKIYPFTNSGNNIDYKKVPAAPQTFMEFNQKSEPSNHVTSFKAQSSGSNITLNWIDATGIIIPDYYAILISKTNFPANPIDGTEPVEDNDLSDGTGLVKVAHGVQSYSGLLNLELLNTYYFKIIPYTNYGSAINYKTDGIVPQTLVYFQSGELANNILCFDGINDNVDCGQLNPTIFSVEAWVNPTILNIDQAILSTLNETGINAGFELHLNSVGKPAFTIRNSGSWVDVVASNAVIANTWTHLAVIFDGIIVKLYVNGVMVNSGSASSFTAGNNALKLGIRSVNGSCQYFKGNIDEVSVWTKALSEPEIQLNMFSKLLGNESDLLVYYNFDQGTGFADNTKVKALNDATSNAIHGTLTGFALTGTTSNWISKNIESSTNNCLSFDGTDDYIAIPVLGSSLTQLTIETWVNLSSATTSGGVFNTNVWNTGSIHFQIWNGTSIEFAVGSNSSTTTTSYTFSADTWYHLAATYNSSTKQVCIYVNGLLIKSETIATTNAVNLTAAQIGAWNNAGTNQRIFSGKMDEYRIWNSVRTQTEIADNMLKSISNPSSVSNLIAYYKMDQGTASGNNFGNISLIDGSAGNMNGALTNFELTGSSSNWLLFDNYSKRIASCNYIFTPVSGTFTSLIGGTQLTNTVSDAISLGFSFNFNGTNYTQAYACMYGWLSFNATKPTSTYENDVVTSNLAALPFLAPLWDFYQNYGAPVSIRYKTEGTTPNKVFTTEWTEMGGLYSTAAQITFQVKLYETTNRIEYIYKQEPQELGYNSATIGYFFADNSYLTLNNTSSTPNVVSNLNYYDQRTKPATGQIYRFEPDVLDEPTSYPTELSTSLENGWLTLNWKDAAGLQIPDGYLILASKDNTFSTPIDNTNLSDDLDLLDGYGRVKVNQGKQTFSGWKHLESSETWYFRLYPFTNSGSSINYKTTNPVAQIRVSYPYYLFTEHNNIFYYEGNSFVTDYQYLTESEAIIGDFNKDGNLDVFVGGDPGGNIVDFNTVYLNDGTGYFTTNAAFTHFEYESMSMTDVDNDSDLDFLITATIGSSYYTVLYTDYNLHENLFRNVKGGASAWADYDNDGDQDLLLTGNTGEGLISKIYRNNGNLGFTEQSAIIIPGIEYGSVAWTDYDKDGYKDFLISGSGITQIYRNTGKENFVEQTIIQLTGLSNSSVAWGDYDNDGYPDILMAGSGVTKIYHNNGDNTFTELLNTGLAGFSSGKVNWGDYDNDGDLDILLSCTNITKLYTNNYPINTFTEDTEVAFYGVENGTTLFADYDRDNDLDVLMPSIQKEYCNNNKIVNTAPSLPDGLISSTKANGLLLKWNKSTDNTTPSDAITYNIKVGTASGLENIVAPMSLSNGTRLVSDRGNMGSDTSVLLIIPKGTYYWSIQAIDNSIVSSAFSAEQPYAMDFVQAADLNASVLTSNSLMLRWTNGNGNSRIVFCKEGNEGTASPVDATTYASDALFGKGDQIGSTGWYCIYSGKADSAIVSGLSIDKSYIFQIIEYTYPSGSPIYYTITGNANPGVFGVNSFLEQKNIVLEELCSGSAIWGDYDNDGFLDFLISGNAYNGTSEHIYEKYLTKIYRNNGNNTFTNTINLLGLNYASAAWGDYDNDGDLDLIITGTTESFVTATKLYRNESGSFVEQAISLPGTSEGSLAWGDYNNDGMLDFIITGSLNSKIYKNIGNNSFEEQTSISLPQVTESEVTWGDMNNDGYLDLVLSGKNSSGAFAKIFINNKNNSFSELVGTPFINAAEGAVALGDYDKDGFMDIFVSGYTCWVCGDPNAKLYHNNGDGSFSEFTGNSFNGIELGTAQWGDYDNDSDLDILITGDRTGSGSISTTIYKNNFPINTFTPIKPIVELGHSAASWGDYDNDGDLDIVIIGRRAMDFPLAKMYQNTTIMKAGSFVANVVPTTPNNLKNELIRGGMLISWDGVTTDETPISTMSYNFRLGASKDSMNLYAPHFVDSIGFKNRMVAQMGNTGLNNFYKIQNLPDLADGKNYYWQVQAVDGGFKGGAWSTIDSLQIKGAQAYFSADTVCLNDSTHFTDNSYAFDGITAWEWNFGDTTAFSDLKNPTHVYQYPGEHSVQLVVTNASGKTDTIENAVYVKPKPNVSFTANDVCSGKTTVITNTTPIANITGWDWDFGDNSTSSYANPGSHVYSNIGSYTIKLSVSSNNGCSAADSTGIVVTTTPNVTLTNLHGNNDFCSYDSVIYTVPLDALASYQWQRKIDEVFTDIGNTSEILKLKSTDSPGDYRVVATNNLAATCMATSETKTITIKEAPGIPIINPESATTFCNGDSVKLNLGTLPVGTTVNWYKNEGPLSVSDAYLLAKEPGSYSAKVTAANGCFLNTQTDVMVNVNPVPSLPSVSYGPTTFCQGGSVTFSTDSLSGLTYIWNKDGLDTSTVISNRLVANSKGDYYLKVKNSQDCYVQTTSVPVEVKANPENATINHSIDTTFCEGQSITLSTAATAANFTWLKDANVYKTGDDTITVAESGVYRLKLDKVYTASNLTCSTTSTDFVTVTKKPKPNIPTISRDGDTTFCQGSSLKLSILPQSDVNYKWYRDGAIFNTVSNEITVNQAGTYKIIIDNDYGCAANSTNSFLVTVNTKPGKPEVSANNTTFCSGDSVTISTLSNGPTYNWLPEGVGTTSSMEINVKNTGNYRLVTYNGFCYSDTSNVIAVKVNPMPDMPQLTYGDTAFCQGNSVTFINKNFDANQYTYQWMNENGLIDNETGKQYTTLHNGNYFLEVKLGNCTVQTTPVAVTVNPNPPVPTIEANGATIFCEGNNVSLSIQALDGATYTWYKDGMEQATNTNSILATDSATYNVKIATAFGCYVYSSNSKNVTVYPTPKISVLSKDGATTFCEGGRVGLSLIIQNPKLYSFNWYLRDADTLLIANDTTSIEATKNGNYWLEVGNSECFAKTPEVNVTVNPMPITPEIEASAETTVCKGTQLTFSFDSLTNTSYKWYRGSSFYNNQTSDTLNITQSGDYYVIASIGSCTAQSITQQAVINPLPATIEMDPDGDQSFCDGNTVTITANGNSTNDFNFQWFDSNYEMTGSTNNKLTVGKTGNYKVLVTNTTTKCFRVSDPVSIEVKLNPDIPVVEVIDNIKEFCEGLSTTLFTDLVGVTYQWRKVNDSYFNDTTYSVKVDKTGQYYLRVSNARDCHSVSDTTAIKVNESPAKYNPTAAGDTNFCDGEYVDLKTNYTNTDLTKYDLKWINDGKTLDGATEKNYRAYLSGNYWLEVTNNSNNCSVTTDKIEVVVDKKPIILTIKEDNNDTIFCPGTPVKLLVTTKENKNYDYQWYNSERAISEATDSIYMGELPAEKYYVEVISGKCTVESQKLELKNKPAPDKPAIYSNGPDPHVWILACGNRTAKDYRWHYKDSLIEGANTYRYVANQNLGDYYVKINEGGECWTKSYIINIPSGDFVSGVSELFSDEVVVYPNPSDGVFQVLLGGLLTGKTTVTVTDGVGKTVAKEEYLDATGFTLELESLKQGVYLCQIENKGMVVMKKLVKE